MRKRRRQIVRRAGSARPRAGTSASVATSATVACAARPRRGTVATRVGRRPGRAPARRPPALGEAVARPRARRGASAPVTPSERRMLARIVVARAHRRSLLRAPLALEGLALRRRRVAVRRPAAGQRQRAKRPLPAGEMRQRAHGEIASPGGRARAPGEERPEPRPQRAGAGDRCALELALAPVAHQLRQRDPHRADALAAAAEGRGVGQIGRPRRRRSAPASAPRPSGRDRPSHRRGRRPPDRPGNGSCRRRSGCSAACPANSLPSIAERPLSSSTT